MSYPANPRHLERFREPAPEPTATPTGVMENWLKRRVERDMRLECPVWLEVRATRNGRLSGIAVEIIYTNEWQVHMTTKRGTVYAAPMIHEQTCMDGCQGSGITPHILDGGGSPCDRCHGKSVTLEEAWRNSLTELGLMS